MDPLDDDRSRIEDLLYYVNLMAGRRFNGSFTVWMYDGRISRSTFSRVRQVLRVAGIPFSQEEHHAQAASEA